MADFPSSPKGEFSGRTSSRMSDPWQEWDDAEIQEADEFEEGSCRYYVAELLYHRFFETLIILLIFTDIGLLSVEAGIDHHVLCISGHVVPKPTNINTAYLQLDALQQHRHDRRVALRGHSQSHDIGRDTYVGSVQAKNYSQTPASYWRIEDVSSQDKVLMCETRDGPRAHKIAHRCHMASIVILFVFFMEISLKLWLDPHRFMSNRFLVLDAVVVVVSLLVDSIAFWYANRGNASSLTIVVACLLFVRMWRVVRIVHGIVEYYVQQHMKHEAEKEKHEELKGHFRKSLKHLDHVVQQCEEKKVNIPEEIKDHLGTWKAAADKRHAHRNQSGLTSNTSPRSPGSSTRAPPRAASTL